MFELVFFTSSRIKLVHAQYLCREYNVQVSGFRQKTFGANYVEPRIYDRDQLIEISYQDALMRWRKQFSEDRLFFIEDTSVKIDALSAEQETPGLDIKYWMEEMNFPTLDKMLKETGNNRKVTVRSDLVLHLPLDLKQIQNANYMRFTGTSDGTIVKSEARFDTNPMYPWLDNKSFNKWFCPGTHLTPISTLPIDVANQFDFRRAAFEQMLSYLETHKKISRRSRSALQTNFGFGQQLFVVCGPSCAGKTTLAEHLCQRYGYYHIEASDFMHLSYYNRHGTASKLLIGDFAEAALREQPEIVSQQIIENIAQHKQTPVVITGFRSFKEIEYFKNNYYGIYPVEVIYVSAKQDARYDRAVKRARDGEANSFEEFRRRDDQQRAMGLADLELRFNSNIIANDSTIDDYFSRFENAFHPRMEPSIDQATSPATTDYESLENSILLALAHEWESREYFTTTEIAQLINTAEPHSPKNKNNVSRYFNQNFYPYFEITTDKKKRKYRLSNTGYGKVLSFVKRRMSSK